MLIRRDRNRLWSLLLFAIVSHSSVGQIQELGGSGCIAESAQAGGNGCRAESAQIVGTVLGGDSQAALGSGMLQVHSKTQLQKPEATQKVFEAQASRTVFSGSGTALESFVGMMHTHPDHIPTLLLGSRTALESFLETNHIPIFLLVFLALLLVCAFCRCLPPEGVGDRDHFRFRIPCDEISQPVVRREGTAGSAKGGSLFRASPLTQASSPCSPVPLARELTKEVSAASAKQPPSQQDSSVVASRYLCPGLVVPDDNECVLAVPVMPVAGLTSEDMVTLNVQALEGKHVLQADVVMPHSARAHDTQRPLVMLRTGCAPRVGKVLDAPLLAYCMAGHESGSRKIAYLYNERNELFAQISKENTNWYVLKRIADGAQLFFEGDIVHHTVTVTNDQSVVVSESSSTLMSFNPGGSYYQLRVAPKVDVGLIICALFSMDCLERY